MAKEQKPRPSLAPPKLFGRRERDAAPEPVPDPTPDPMPDPMPEAPAEDAPEAVTEVVEAPAPQPAPEPEPEPEPEPATVAPSDTAVLAAAASGIAGTSSTIEPDPIPDPPIETGDDVPEPAARPRRRLSLPGQLASAVIGVVVGLALVGLTWAAFQGCEAVQDTSSCGTGPGITLLIVIFVLGVVLGRVLLGLAGQPDPLSTSFLATGFTAVVAMLFLIDVLDHWSMLLAIPGICAVSFLLSWWVSTTFVREADSASRE